MTWNQASNATGYVAYIGTTSGFTPGMAIQSQLASEPDRIAIFQGLTLGTYYIIVVSTSITCPGTDPSTELTVQLSLPSVFKLCMRSNNALCLKDTLTFAATGKIALETTNHTTFEFEAETGGNHLRSIDSPQNAQDAFGRACFEDSGVPILHEVFVMGGFSACEFWTYDPSTGRIESNCGRFLTVDAVSAGSQTTVISPGTPQGARSQWDLITP